MKDMQDDREYRNEVASNAADWQAESTGLAGDVHAGARAAAGQTPTVAAKPAGGSAVARAPLRRSLFRT